MKKKLKNKSLFEARRLNVLAGLTEAYGHEDVVDPDFSPPVEEEVEDDAHGAFDWGGYDELEGEDDPLDDGANDINMSSVDSGDVDDNLDSLYLNSVSDGYDNDDILLDTDEPLDSDPTSSDLSDVDPSEDSEEWLRNQQSDFKMESKKRRVKSVKLTETQFRQLMKKYS